MDEPRQVMGYAMDEVKPLPGEPSPRRPANVAAPIRVATLLDGNELFGLPHALANVLEGIDAAKVQTIGLFLGPGTGRDLLAPRFAETRDFGVGPLSPLRRPGRPKYDVIYLAGRARCYFRCKRAVTAWARRHRPAILHTHVPMMTRLAWGATRGLPVRRVWHCHGAYPYKGSSSRRFIAFAQRALHRIIAISQFVADTMPAELRDRVRVVHNCVPVARLRQNAARGAFRAKYGIAPDQPLIGIFGAVIPIKGHVYFVEAAARVLARYPTARFAVVGGTTEAFKSRGVLDELDGHIRRVGIGERVIQTGFLPDATRYMTDFDVIAMPSISTAVQAGEGFGMVLVEAMAQGVATIATRCGAPPELVDDGRTGLLVPPRDSEALAEAMLHLLDHADARTAMAQAAAQAAEARYDPRIAAARLEAVYEELLRSTE